MIIIAASLYLPEHITTMLSRAWFYYAGDEAAAAGAGMGTGMGMGVDTASRLKGNTGRMEGEDVIDMLGRL